MLQCKPRTELQILFPRKLTKMKTVSMCSNLFSLLSDLLMPNTQGSKYVNRASEKAGKADLANLYAAGQRYHRATRPNQETTQRM